MARRHERPADEAERVIALVERDIAQSHEEFVYWPLGGYTLSADDLRLVADELDRRNASWQATMRLQNDEAISEGDLSGRRSEAEAD
jgi:hypothetical protein